MSGADFVFNTSKGRVAYYASLPAANDALVMVLCKATGLATDIVLRDLTDLGTILAGSTDEATFTNYTRQVLTTVTVTVDNTNDIVNIDCDDVTYTNAGGASNNTMGKALICYDPDTTTGTDSSVVPIAAYSYDGTTDGSTIVLTMPTNGPLFAS